MTLDQIAQIAAILSVSVPLAALAWSAVAYVHLRGMEIQRERYQRFFEVMGHLEKGGSIASQMAAVYELRKFPEYADVIGRLFERSPVIARDGNEANAVMLKSEIDLTVDFLRRGANR